MTPRLQRAERRIVNPVGRDISTAKTETVMRRAFT